MANKTPKNPKKAFKQALDKDSIVMDTDAPQLEALGHFLAGQKKIKVFTDSRPKKG